MKNNEEKEITIDILKNIEILSSKVNELMANRTKSVFRRYPLTFALLVLVGAMLVTEGLKGMIETLGFLGDHPGYMLILGLIILIITGRVYKKLDK